MRGDGTDPKASERWEAEKKAFLALDEQDQFARLANRVPWPGVQPEFPEDHRMQLTWGRLTLHPTVPDGLALPG